jgi:hypothetical protein
MSRFSSTSSNLLRICIISLTIILIDIIDVVGSVSFVFILSKFRINSDKLSCDEYLMFFETSISSNC